MTITFSEPVEGFELEDIRVTNGTASNFTKVSPREYTATIMPEEIGEVRVEVPEDVAEDVAGNGNPAAEPLVIEADLERPEVTIEGPTEPVGIAGFEVTIAFSEPVEGFELEDIRVTNGTASHFTKVSPQEYTATIMPEGIGEVRVEIPEDVAEDVAGNGKPGGGASGDRGGSGAAGGNDRRADGAGGNSSVRSDDRLLGACGALLFY